MEASLLLMKSLCCIKEGTCEWRDCVLSREGGSCRAWLWQELMCVFESVYLCVNGNPDDLCLILYECA